MRVLSHPPNARTLSLVGLASLCGLNCTERGVTAPGVLELVPTFQAFQITPGPPNWTDCDEGINVVREPHFIPDPPPLTLYDSVGALAGQCGNLDFDGRLRWFEVTYATGIAGEYPYKYWWTRWRDKATGATREMWDTLIVLDSGVLDSARVIEMRLLERADAVATMLLISDDGSYQLTDSAFLDPGWYAVEKENIFVQHWDSVPAPVLDSALAASPLTVSLHWRNGVARDIDSTVVFRNDVEIGGVAGGAYTHTDTLPSTGTYRYSLKHVTRPLFAHWARPTAIPNSASSNELLVTTNYAPEASFSVACQQLPCTFTDGSSDADGTIVSWDWTFGDGDTSSAQHPTHTYPAGGDYQVRLIATDNVGARDTALGWAHPLQLGLLGPTTVRPKVTCEWDAYPQGGSGGMVYSWVIGGQEVGSDEYLYWYTGTSGFQITLLGQAGDGQADTAVVTVTLDQNAPSCVLKQGSGR